MGLPWPPLIKLGPFEIQSFFGKRARFRRETQTRAALNHPTIAAIGAAQSIPVKAHSASNPLTSRTSQRPASSRVRNQQELT